MSETISEADLNAYVDDQLDIMRRLAVEDYLARNPQLASRVIADLRARDALRIVLRTPLPLAAGRTIEAAAKLRNKLVWRNIVGKLRQIAAVGLLIGVGWLAHDGAGLLRLDAIKSASAAPVFVADAIIAHRTELMRRQMERQSHQLTYDPAEIEAQLKIRIPKLPTDWSVRDVQIFPSHEGGSVEASIVASSLGRISMFAARMDTSRLQPPAVASHGAETTIYWQTGHQAVALTATDSGPPLQRAGWALFATAVRTSK